MLGDLSFLHDIGALQIAANYPVHLLVVVINNDGGGIFSFLPQACLGAPFEPFFATPHGLDFERSASLGRADYRKASSWSAFRESVAAGLANHGLHVLEVAFVTARRNTDSHRRIIESALAACGLKVLERPAMIRYFESRFGASNSVMKARIRPR